ncbi:MAG: PQQ-like beta-propeller repeat protein [Thermoguttaceae bacterium]|nr:PQQ-like beta-propeller repeat protein [Thermoguttaceae bacterium]MDW8038193.1 PQQ-binding-like beta-propeller repeat protein [Thermoguttaceae bacterium]
MKHVVSLWFGYSQWFGKWTGGLIKAAFGGMLIIGLCGWVGIAAEKKAIATSGAKGTGDWTRFRGPNCDGKCLETGLLKSWPEGGPKLLWTMEGLGRGYSSLTIAGGKIFTTGDRPDPKGGESQYVMAFDLASRKELWATPIGPPHPDGGCRSTPTIDGDLAFVIGTEGDLVCVETATGRLRWRKSFPRDFGGRMMSGWKYSESPLVDGDKVVCTPGGPVATVVALNKYTGKLIWRCAVPPLGPKGADGAGYSSMVAADIQGLRQYITIIGRGAIGVAAKDGRFLWGYNRIANNVANIPTPIVRDNYVFVTTSYRTGSALLRIVRRGEKFLAEEVWFNGPQDFENHHGGVVLVGDYLYGGSGQNQGVPVCLEFLTGKVVWRAQPVGQRSAAVLYADGHLIFRYEDGMVALIEATPEGFRLKGKFMAPVRKGPSWAHPVIHDGKLYLRSHDTLMCFDLRNTSAE